MNTTRSQRITIVIPIAALCLAARPATAQTGVAQWERVDVPSVTTFFEDVWATRSANAPTVAFAVGLDSYVGSGVVYRYDGTSWTPQLSANINLLYGVWGTGPSDVFAVGNNVIMHYDGIAWHQFLVGGNNEMRGVWGSSPTNVFAVGRHGAILHYTGPKSNPFDEWAAMNSGTGEDLEAVWGSGPNDVWAVGDVGTLIHFDGSQWSAFVPPLSFPDPRDDERLTDIDGTSSDNIVAVGYNGVIRRFNGDDWSYEDSHTTNHLLGVTIAENLVAYAVGWDGVVLRNDGAGWGGATSAVTSADIVAIHTIANGAEIIAVGIAGVILHRPEFSNSWIVRSLAAEDDYDGIWGSGAGDIWAVGANGRIVHFDGLSWSVRSSTTDHHFSGIWGASAMDVFATVDQPNNIDGVDVGYGEIFHYDGSSWSEVKSTTDPMRDVWGSGPNNVYAVGVHGELRHFDGVVWTKVPISQDIEFAGVWGSAANDVYVVGYNHDTSGGTIIHFDGANWTASALPSEPGTLTCVWGSGPSDVFAVGHESSLWNFNGTSWHLLVGPPVDGNSIFGGGALNGIWGTGPDNVYAVGDYGYILHYDGSYWERMNSGTKHHLRAIWGSETNNIYVAGENGLILHYPRSPAPPQGFPSGGVCCATGFGNAIPLLATLALLPFFPLMLRKRRRASEQRGARS